MSLIFALGSIVSYKIAIKVGENEPELATGLIMVSGFLCVCALALIGNYIFYV